VPGFMFVSRLCNLGIYFNIVNIYWKNYEKSAKNELIFLVVLTGGLCSGSNRVGG
jgi:hypothetical protein